MVIQRNEATANQVASIATEGARPLNYNHFKVPLMENLVKRAIRGLSSHLAAASDDEADKNRN